jgi:hypothetical protein
MSDIRKGAGDNDAIEARQYASDLILVTFNERERWTPEVGQGSGPDKCNLLS